MGRDLGFFCSFQKMKGTAAQQGNYTGWKEKTKQSNQWQSLGWRTKCRLTKSPVRCNLDYFLSHPSSMLAAAATANSSQGGLLGQGPAEEVKWCLPLPADPLSSCFPAPAGRLLHCHLPICDAPHPAGSRGHAARGCWGDHFLPEARHVQAGRPTGEGWCQQMLATRMFSVLWPLELSCHLWKEVRQPGSLKLLRGVWFLYTAHPFYSWSAACH